MFPKKTVETKIVESRRYFIRKKKPILSGSEERNIFFSLKNVVNSKLDIRLFNNGY